MYGLPQTLEVNRQLAKQAIYAKFELKPSERSSFDADISRIVISHSISPNTVPALQKGKDIVSIYVLQVTLKRINYNEKNIIRLSRLIPQNVLFALCYKEKTRFAIYHAEHLFCTEWKPDAEAYLFIEGGNMDIVWDNFVKFVGGILIEDDKSLVEQIKVNETRNALQKQIDQLKRKVANEKQPQKKYELHKLLIKLKSQI